MSQYFATGKRDCDSKSCTCKKAGLLCSDVCEKCSTLTCKNYPILQNEEFDDVDIKDVSEENEDVEERSDDEEIGEEQINEDEEENDEDEDFKNNIE